MYKQILCPVDGSATSNCGMREAIRLAKYLNAKLRFLYVVDTYFPILDVTGDFNVIYVADMLRDNGKKVLKKAEVAAHKAGIVAESKVVESIGDQVAKCVLDDIDESHADLIVMGTHGLRGVERLVMGSDAETVARSSPIPVLLVRNTQES
ncbi:putative universal stress protein [mine drainage metagenome]|uniref:Putative universal stress protein n=1 Tax=mine drainage metagenome TaxID=410659 RepID=A0A1J5TBV4_9ZZZZ